jgi:hypothetical protein
MPSIPPAARSSYRASASRAQGDRYRAAAVGTLVLALITGALAWQTSKLVAETAESIQQAHVHHEQTFMPYIRAIDGIGSLSLTSGLAPGRQIPGMAYSANTQLTNLGSGIAVNVRILVLVLGERYEFINRRTNAAPAIPPIRVRDQVGLSDWDPIAIMNIPAAAVQHWHRPMLSTA